MQPIKFYFSPTLHIPECHVCSLSAYSTCHSSLQPAGDKMAEYGSSSSSTCFRLIGWRMEITSCPSADTLHIATKCIYRSLFAASISFFLLFHALCVNWFSGERVPSGGQAPGGVWCPDRNYPAEEADHREQDQGGEGEVNTGARDDIYFAFLSILYPDFTLISFLSCEWTTMCHLFKGFHAVLSISCPTTNNINSFHHFLTFNYHQFDIP